MKHDSHKKILAVASIGGHWIQLLRIVKPMAERYDVVYVSTHKKCATMIGYSHFHTMTDFSRWDIWKAVPATFQALRILIKEHPKAVITTGAAPGLIVLLIAKLLGIKTIWVDSVANASEPSGSGKIAAKFATRCYTQWPEIANDRFTYAGNIFEIA